MSSERSGLSTTQTDAEELRAWLQAGGNSDEALLGAGYQGSAYFFSGSAGPSVVKMPNSGGWFGAFQAWMIRREYAIYERMGNILGVPKCYGLIDRRCLVLEFVEGGHLKEKRYELRETEAFFAELLEVLHRLHAVGVAHGDLKRRDNVLVTPEQRPCIIDFGAAVQVKTANRWWYSFWERVDYNSWVKLKYRADLESISESDLQWYRPTLIESWNRSARRFVRTVTFRQHRKARTRARDADDT